MLHIRNLPYETTEEELIELCQPFGKLVQTKLNVGANKNQAFVEFTDMNAAIQMVSYYASSADPAKVCSPCPCTLTGRMYSSIALQLTWLSAGPWQDRIPAVLHAARDCELQDTGGYTKQCAPCDLGSSDGRTLNCLVTMSDLC